MKNKSREYKSRESGCYKPGAQRKRKCAPQEPRLKPIARANLSGGRKRLTAAMIACLLITLSAASGIFAQNVKNTDYSHDKSLKSNARVNPSTLAMEFSLPISGYAGRAGNGLPVAFDYSSKVWEVKAGVTWQSIVNGSTTDTRAVYAKRTAAGWTSNLGVPRIDYKTDIYFSNLDNPNVEDGQIFSPPEDNSPYNEYYVKRVHVQLPGGSTHEFRANDTPILCGTTATGCAMDLTGTFLSVDGSKMRLELAAQESTLSMPDGSRYVFGAVPQTGTEHRASSFFDRHGNRMDYNQTSKQWTDTLGRVVSDPMPMNWTGAQQTQTVGDTVASFPSVGSGTMNVTMSWRYLKDPNGGESGLSNPNQSLGYTSDIKCVGNQQQTLAAPNLFQSYGGGARLCGDADRFNPVVLTKITFPNGQSYKFGYDVHGEIDKIVYPSGGYERFVYAQVAAVQRSIPTYDVANRGVVDRWVSARGDGTDEVHWSYAASRGTQYPFDPYKVTITNPDGSRTEQLLHDESDINVQRPYGFDNAKTGRPYETRAYTSANQLMRRTLTKYETTGAQAGGFAAATRDIRPVKEISITFEQGASSALAAMSETVYDSNADAQYFAALNPKQSKTYHYVALGLSAAQNSNIDQIAASFSTNQLAGTSEVDYLYDSNYKARNIVTLPVETRVKDAAGNTRARSQIGYDETGLISAGTDNQWTDPNTNYRGNPTMARSWTDVANNQFVETHAQYDNFGNQRKAWDAKGNLSETEYSQTYKFAFPTKVISPIPDASGQNGSSTAFETTSTYDLTTGLPLTTTDANGQVTSMEYNDAMLRPTKVIPPSGAGQTVMEYTDTPGAISVKTKTQIDAVNWAESIVYADGLGRAVKSQKKDNQGDVFTETEYDLMGRVKRATNPYRAGETKLWTESAFDDMGRAVKIKTPDNAEVNTTFDLATSGTLGSVVTVTDQAGKTRRSVTNALGQLSRVDEPNDAGNLGAVSNPNQATNYGYDTLNNLIQVNQGVQTRTFQYDSLSRLKQAQNPESGTINYNYDANGNLTNKTDARSIATVYAYDNLNRVKSRTYSDSTPPVNYFYDNLANARGRLIKVSSSVSESNYNWFDNLGRILSSQQMTDGNVYNFGYNYNLAGMLLSETYPSGRVVTNGFATDGSLAQVATQAVGASNQSRADNFNYTSAGAVSAMRLGNNRWESAQFNSRLQPVQLSLGNSSSDTSLWKVNYDYGTTDNNGNVKGQTITVPSINPLVQTYSYDSLNRLKSAQETSNGSQTWKQTFVYDRYGNRQFDAGQTTTLGSCPANQCNPQIDQANNRFTTNQGYTYDNSGNVVTDAQGRTFYFDAENKQKEVRNNQNQIVGQYLYDGDGKRVKKLSAQETTLFIYDAGGKMTAEYAVTNSTPQTPTTSYLTMDNLGSPRVVTDSSGNVQSRRDFMPFGEEIAGLGNRTSGLGYQSDSVRQKFTSYERDIEANLDFAQNRYYNFSHGRFTTVDPLRASAKTDNPQSWNRYSYTFNNPLNFVDPTGLLAMDDYFINRDGSYVVVENDCKCDTYYVETEKGSGEYRGLGTLQENDLGLVNFPASMNFFGRYAPTEDRGGGDHGPGDHYVKPEVAAGLFGLAAVLKDDYGITMSFGDMSSSNGRDPWQPGEKHHVGHGHDERSGLDVDFRYINKDGVSFQSKTARSDSQFSVEKNQTVYDTAAKFGFTENYQGTSQGRNTGLQGPKPIGGHNDHGHIGFNAGSRRVTYAQGITITRGIVKPLFF